MTLDSKNANDRKPSKKTPEESLRELRRQYATARENGNTALLRRMESIFAKLGESPVDSQLSKALKKRK